MTKYLSTVLRTMPWMLECFQKGMEGKSKDAAVKWLREHRVFSTLVWTPESLRRIRREFGCPAPHCGPRNMKGIKRSPVFNRRDAQ